VLRKPQHGAADLPATVSLTELSQPKATFGYF